MTLRRLLAAALAALLPATPAPAADTPAGAFARASYTTSLKGHCPNPLVVQLDWLPQAEHGGLFQLIGDAGRMSQGRYRGPLGATGIDLLLLAGGKGMGLGDGETPYSALYMGNSRAGLRPHLALVDLDNMFIFSDRFPTIGVVAPLDKSPMGLFWDRATYPGGFRSIADLRKFAASGRGKIYLSTTRRTFGRYLLQRGLSRDGIMEGYNGDGENFVLNGGRWLNQGSIISEGYQFSNGKRWNRPVDFLLLSDMGYPIYPGVVTVRRDRLSALSTCLERLVPMMQQAQIDYARRPAIANNVLFRFNEAGLGAPWWKTSRALLEAAASTMVRRDIVGNGSDATLGNFDMKRSTKVLALLRPSLDIRAVRGVTPAMVVTNRFIDPAKGLR